MARGSRRLVAPAGRARGVPAPSRMPQQDSEIPNVYRNMLQDDAPSLPHNSRPPKRRRLVPSSEQADHAPPYQETSVAAEEPRLSSHPAQTVFESSDESDEENFDWEDVEIGGGAADDEEKQPGESLTIVLGDGHE